MLLNVKWSGSHMGTESKFPPREDTGLVMLADDNSLLPLRLQTPPLIASPATCGDFVVL